MPSLRRNSFFKGHALGNDYIVMDPATLDCRLDPSTIRTICDRNRGVGGDGIIGIGSSSRADFGISIYNADGSEAETSGNGLRIFGLYALHSGRTTENDFCVETKTGISRVRLETGPDGYVSASASMGRASFTLASGSSSCAAASAAVRLGLVRSPVTVNAPGGSVSIEVDEEFNLVLTGPVTSVCDGYLSPSFVKAVNAACGTSSSGELFGV